MTQKKKSVEQRVADVILQKKMTVSVGGREFEVARPTIATLYEVSAIVSELAKVEMGEMSDNMQDIITETLRIAKYAPVHAATLAILILGAKEGGHKERGAEKRSFGLVKRAEKSVRHAEINRFEELKSFILYNGSPREVQEAIVRILGTNAETPYFFSTSCFLKGSRITAPTRGTTPGR